MEAANEGHADALQGEEAADPGQETLEEAAWPEVVAENWWPEVEPTNWWPEPTNWWPEVDHGNDAGSWGRMPMVEAHAEAPPAFTLPLPAFVPSQAQVRTPQLRDGRVPYFGPGRH